MIHVNYIEGLEELVRKYSFGIEVYLVQFNKDEFSYWRSRRYFVPTKCYKCGTPTLDFVGARVFRQLRINGELANRQYVAPVCRKCAESASIFEMRFVIPRLFLTLPSY